jgi:hypothetical protein
MIASGYQIYLFSIEKTKECLVAASQEPRTKMPEMKEPKNQDAKNQRKFQNSNLKASA